MKPTRSSGLVSDFFLRYKCHCANIGNITSSPLINKKLDHLTVKTLDVSSLFNRKTNNEIEQKCCSDLFDQIRGGRYV